jgi:hypothetical protein
VKRRGPHRLWTEAEDDWLRVEWETTDIVQLSRRLSRSVGALTERVRKLKLLRKTLTLRAFARLHAVPITRVYWAIEQRSIKPARVRRIDPRQMRHHGSHFALTPAQQDVLRPLLHTRPKRLLRLDGEKTPRGVWGIGIKPGCCKECATKNKPHFAKGYCKACYVKVFKWQQNRRKNPLRRPRSGSVPESLFVKE